jgi:hypothetical protein
MKPRAKLFLEAEGPWGALGRREGTASAANFIGMTLQAEKDFDQA